ncbi:hypothetical protein HPP92_006767 [Vanilla planifolia]|uniref:Uncharacterized protein n=1 Tax=Vanilla planifolia TaxID=51239 RepID=A0A835R8X7_VANPL|nr:hypothetical protein HPP92_006767 [Vanilla planifolia]
MLLFTLFFVAFIFFSQSFLSTSWDYVDNSSLLTGLELDLEWYVVHPPTCVSANVYAANLTETPRTVGHDAKFTKHNVSSCSHSLSKVEYLMAAHAASDKVFTGNSSSCWMVAALTDGCIDQKKIKGWQLFWWVYQLEVKPLLLPNIQDICVGLVMKPNISMLESIDVSTWSQSGC